MKYLEMTREQLISEIERLLRRIEDLQLSDSGRRTKGIIPEKNAGMFYSTESEGRFKNAFEYSAAGMALISCDGRFIQSNKSFCDTVGYTWQELSDLTFWDISYPEDAGKVADFSGELLSGNLKSYQMEKRFLHKNGNPVWVLLTASLVSDADGSPMHFIIQIQNIDQRKKMEEKLIKLVEETEKARQTAEKLAATDHLTGLLNRRAFMDLLAAEASRSKREETPLSLIIADIDHFKEINDTYGHQAGDACLQSFASCVSRQCRRYDFIARYGGEEFIICLPNTTCQQAVSIAERMRATVQDLPVALPGNVIIHLTACFGVSGMEDSDPEKGFQSLIARADEALYMAKTRSRNRVCVIPCRAQSAGEGNDGTTRGEA